MHPELLRAVMLDRQERLLRQGEFRGHHYRPLPRRQGRRVLFSRPRARIGRALVSIGSRLAASGPGGSERRSQTPDPQSLGGQSVAVR
jgi:hypothetical protein